MVASKEAKKAADKSGYSAKQITVLEGLEPVRRRPGMYIGSTGPSGLHHLIWEVVDNSIDEAMGGHADRIIVKLLPDGWVSVEDNGRGIPVDIHAQYKKSALELVLTKLHAGGKFGGGGYKVSGGLHGVGVSVVNALSDELRAEVKRDGYLWTQTYNRGVPRNKVKAEKKATGAGTTIFFKPDASIFETIEFTLKTILDHLRQQAYLTKGIRMEVHDARDKGKDLPYAFYFEGGVASYVAHINHGKTIKHPNIFYISKHSDDTDIDVEVAVQYTEEYHESIFCFANNIYNLEGGMHLVGFRSALTRELNNYARGKGFIKEKDANLTGDDVREGLTSVISVKLREPQFEGQTKAKLGNPEARTAVEAIFGEAFRIYLEEHPADAESIIGKCVLSAQARAAARAARETVLRKGVLEGLTLPGKLADCSSKDPERSEIFIVEGDSAGGCFSGETEVALADGRRLSFKDLVEEWQKGKTNYCYTIKNDGQIGIEKILSPRITKRKADVIKITLDNNETIICTPDHLFMLRDGSFKAAKELKNNISLMPLQKKTSQIGGRITIDGYEMALNPQNHKWIFTHLLSDQYNLANDIYKKESGEHKHHLDFNKLNNNPDNLIRMTKEEHLDLHRQHIGKTLHTKQAIAKCNAIKKTPEYRQKISAIIKNNFGRMLSQKAKEEWQNLDLLNWRKQETTKQWTDDFRAKRRSAYNRIYLNTGLDFAKKIYEKTGDINLYDQERLALSKKNPNLVKLETLINKFFNGDKKLFMEAVENYNHKIKKIEKINKKIDVYDIEVPNTHNFALASGVFVHNSAKQGRDRETQAILPLRGKILNVERARLDKMLVNNEIKSLIIALGTNIGEAFDISSLRYKRIIIMTDADVDGAHIRTLLLTLFYRHFPELVKQGHVFIAKPPLFRIQVGKEVRWAFTEEEKLSIVKDLAGGKGVVVEETDQPSPSESAPHPNPLPEGEGELDEDEEQTKKGPRVIIQRYKGLGEMNPEQLWETTMDPTTRVMKQITIEDAEQADEMFDVLMGSDVAPRKRFIQTHAKNVQNLDI